MDKNNPNRPAHPTVYPNGFHTQGLTKLEYMSLHLMGAIITTDKLVNFRNAATLSINAASILLEELQKKEDNGKNKP